MQSDDDYREQSQENSSNRAKIKEKKIIKRPYNSQKRSNIWSETQEIKLVAFYSKYRTQIRKIDRKKSKLWKLLGQLIDTRPLKTSQCHFKSLRGELPRNTLPVIRRHMREKYGQQNFNRRYREYKQFLQGMQKKLYVQKSVGTVCSQQQINLYNRCHMYNFYPQFLKDINRVDCHEQEKEKEQQQVSTQQKMLTVKKEENVE